MKFSSPVTAPVLLVAAAATTAMAAADTGASLDKLARDSGKIYFGTASDADLISNTNHADLLKSNFGAVTHEYSMKWGFVQPTRGTFDFSTADQLVDFAVQNGQSIRGHTLVWHVELPGWVEGISDAAELTEVIQTHISTVVGRYKGQIRAWDVVNEIFNDDGSLRDSVFSRVLGEDFVRVAFEAAAKADPDALLYINDYNLDNAEWAKITTGMVPSVTKWRNNGIPIHGIGSQAHLVPGLPGGIQAALKALAESGVDEIAITELDIEGADPDDFWTVTNACLNINKCVGITTWGIADSESWKPDTTPLLFNSNYAAKDAYWAVADALGWSG